MSHHRRDLQACRAELFHLRRALSRMHLHPRDSWVEVVQPVGYLAAVLNAFLDVTSISRIVLFLSVHLASVDCIPEAILLPRRTNSEKEKQSLSDHVRFLVRHEGSDAAARAICGKETRERRTANG
jgi:hypothetical protein